MSNLKHLSVPQLKEARYDCSNYMDSLKSKLVGQEERLKWIEQYLHEKTPQEMTFEEVEQKLGHKLIIKR